MIISVIFDSFVAPLGSEFFWSALTNFPAPIAFLHVLESKHIDQVGHERPARSLRRRLVQSTSRKISISPPSLNISILRVLSSDCGLRKCGARKYDH